MDWGDEKFIRVYCRDTENFSGWGWEAQALIFPIMRRLDESGEIDLCGKDPTEKLKELFPKFPVEFLKTGLEELLRTETFCVRDGSIFMPKFAEAQQASITPRQRKRAERARKRLARNASARPDAGEISAGTPQMSRSVTGKKGGMSRSVTGGKGGMSRSVTISGPEVSRSVTFERDVTDFGPNSGVSRIVTQSSEDHKVSDEKVPTKQTKTSNRGRKGTAQDTRKGVSRIVTSNAIPIYNLINYNYINANKDELESEFADAHIVRALIAHAQKSLGIQPRSRALTPTHVQKVRRTRSKKSKPLTQEQLDEWACVIEGACSFVKKCFQGKAEFDSAARSVMRLDNLSREDKFQKYLEIYDSQPRPEEKKSNQRVLFDEELGYHYRIEHGRRIRVEKT